MKDRDSRERERESVIERRGLALGGEVLWIIVAALQRVQGSGFRVQGSGFRVQGSGCRVQDLGLAPCVDASTSRAGSSARASMRLRDALTDGFIGAHKDVS